MTMKHDNSHVTGDSGIPVDVPSTPDSTLPIEDAEVCHPELGLELTLSSIHALSESAMSAEIAASSKVPPADTINPVPATEPVPGRPTEQLEVEDGGPDENEVVYPTGRKLWLSFTALLICCILRGQNITRQPIDPLTPRHLAIALVDVGHKPSALRWVALGEELQDDLAWDRGGRGGRRSFVVVVAAAAATTACGDSEGDADNLVRVDPGRE